MDFFLRLNICLLLIGLLIGQQRCAAGIDLADESCRLPPTGDTAKFMPEHGHLTDHAPEIQLPPQDTQPAKTSISIDVKLELKTKPVSGRMYLMFSRQNRSPINGPNWFSPEPFYGIDVSEFKTGDRIEFNGSTPGLGGTLADLPSGRWIVQAILDHDFFFSSAANGPGNFHSRPTRIEVPKNGSAKFSLSLSEIVPEKPLPETEFFKVIQSKSERLSKFHGRDVFDRAGIVLPNSYATHPTKRYPVRYEITGFSGTLQSISQRYGRRAPLPAAGEVEFIRVYLTGQCKWGHHVYANSATNGPRGDALVKELIPLIDKQFRTVAEPAARFVGGHSSGGWSSLWLQVNYPDTFGGVWSTGPDPVDFRDWQGTNLYAGESVFVDEAGNRKPLARAGIVPILMYDRFNAMDDVLKRGGQLRSFEAVFSPQGDDGNPKRCWDRKSGRPNPEVVEYWKRYDISLLLQQNWERLKPKLAGKIHVYMGSLDTFYLEQSTVLLGERLKELGSDAVVEIFDGKDHMNLLNRSLNARIRREMSQAYLKHFTESGSRK